MTTDRFDTISKLFASRRTLRGAITGGAGLAATALTGPALAQTGTPEVAGVATSGDPHPGADTAAQPEFLFVQPFDSGTWAPKPGEEDIYTITLTGAAAQTVYFSDRPKRIFGVTPMQDFLDTLGFSPDDPPNAALVAPIADSDEEEILIIELLNPGYDASSATLTYDARVLAEYHENGLAHAATRQQDYAFPTSFDRGSLFIDDCPDLTYSCIDSDGNNAGDVTIEQKYGPNGCGPTWVPPYACAYTYPDTCLHEYIDWEGADVSEPLCKPELHS